MAKTIEKEILTVKSVLLLAFLEGLTVMTIELAGGKIVSAYYGSSFFVWTFILGFTMLALAAGYYAGGKISSSGRDLQKKLARNLLLGSFFLFIAPVIANSLFNSFSEFSLYTGLFLVSAFILFPSLFFYSTVCSVLIQISSPGANAAGMSAGRIFAVSTGGGITAAYLLGFFLIPELGVSLPILFVAGLTIAVTVILFLKSLKLPVFAVVILLFIGSAVITHKKVSKDSSDSFRVMYQSEGILGQLKVLDYYPPGKPFSVRKLLINGIPQTYIINDPAAYSFWRYPHFIAAYSTLKEAGSDVLLAGLGGGSVARELIKLGFKTDVVEMDKRIVPLSSDFFFLDTSAFTAYVDDIRHYIRTTEKKYDLVVYDVASGEVQPNFAFTKEALAELRKVLKPDGQIIVNFQGILNEKEQKAFATLYRTFTESGFNTYFWATDPNAFDDIVFCLSDKALDFSRIDTSRFSECCRTLPLMKEFLKKPASTLNEPLTGTEILTDNRPRLDYLNRKSIVAWRKEMLKDITNKELEEGLSIFK